MIVCNVASPSRFSLQKQRLGSTTPHIGGLYHQWHLKYKRSIIITKIRSMKANEIKKFKSTAIVSDLSLIKIVISCIGAITTPQILSSNIFHRFHQNNFFLFPVLLKIKDKQKKRPDFCLS